MLLATETAEAPMASAQKPALPTPTPTPDARATKRSISPAVSPPWEANGDTPEVVNSASESGPRGVSGTPSGSRRPQPSESAIDTATTARSWREWPPLADVQALISSNARLRAHQAADELASVPPPSERPTAGLLPGDQRAAPLASAWLPWSVELDRLRLRCRSAEEAVSEAERHIDAEEGCAKQRTVAHREECAAIREAAARREEALLRRIAELERGRAARDEEIAAVRQDVAEFSGRASRVIRLLRERVVVLESEMAPDGSMPSAYEDVDDDSIAALQHELEYCAATRSSSFSQAVSAFSLEVTEVTGRECVSGSDLTVSAFFRSIDACDNAGDDGDVCRRTTISSVGDVSESSASSSVCARSVAALGTVVPRLEADIARRTQEEEMQRLCAEEQRLEQLEAALDCRAQELANVTSQPDSNVTVESMPSFENAQNDVSRLRKRITELHSIRLSRAQLEESAAAQESELRQLRSEQDQLFEFAYREGLLDLAS